MGLPPACARANPERDYPAGAGNLPVTGSGASGQSVKPRREFTGARAPIRNVVFSKDGKSLAAGTATDEVRIWDVAS